MGRPSSSKGHNGGRGIVLHITEEIITNAKVRDSGHCVIADALQAAIPGARRISVDLQTIRFTDPQTQRRYVFLTPAPAQRVLVGFDQGVRPDPFDMRLGRPAQIAKAGRNAPGSRVKTVKVKSNGRPEVAGGKLPPTAALSSTRGRRRTFGLRSLRP